MITIKDLAKNLISKHQITSSDGELFIQQMVEVINDGLLRDRQVKIKGFGTFKLQAVKERASINVNTGERVMISEHDKVTFTPDNTMKDLINKPFAQFETVIVGDDSPLLDGTFEVAVDDEDNDDNESADVDATPVVEKMVVEEPHTEAVEEKVVEESLTAVENISDETVVTPPELPENETIEEDVTVGTNEDEAPLEAPSDNLAEETPTEPIPETIEEEPAAPEDEETVQVQEESEVQEHATEIKAPEPQMQNQEQENPDLLIENAEQPNDEVNDNHISFRETAESTENNVGELPESTSKLYETESVITDDNSSCNTQYTHCRNIFIYYGIIINIVVALIAFAIGYLLADYHPAPEEKQKPVYVVAGKAHPKKHVVSKPKATTPKVDSIKTEKHSTSVPEKTEVTPSKEQQQVEKPLRQYDTDARVRTGAYYIMGTLQTVTAKEGQTLQSISRKVLGPGLDCYTEAYNNYKNVKAGDVVKIPLLKLKKQVNRHNSKK